MKTYENSYFRFRLEFPEVWKLTSWRHTKIAQAWKDAYQKRDDDLPKMDMHASKFLFTASLHPPESDALVDADIELSVSRLALGEDMRTTLLGNFERVRAYYDSNGIKESIVNEGVWSIGNKDFTFVDQESKSRGRQSRYRFFFRPHHEAFWLYGKVAGHKLRLYQEALKIVESLTPTVEGGIRQKD